jgi:UDP-2,3-diacylglucosamine pyrophosphatase LpxH
MKKLPDPQHFFSKAQEIQLGNKDKWVIFSDLHMGNGSSRDDFLPNSALFNSALYEYYIKNNFGLILNGDVEELHKFTFRSIYSKWKDTYRLFNVFAEKNRFYKTSGNHDSFLKTFPPKNYPYKLYDVLKISDLEYPMLIFHGHQFSSIYDQYNEISRIGIKYITKPLGIKNITRAHDSKKKHHVEKKIYSFSRQWKIISIIGHTHRPLFESLTKSEIIRFRIEYLLIEYGKAGKSEKKQIEKEIRSLKEELIEWQSRKNVELQSGIYEKDDIPIPCMFNSGTVIGKRGITCLEIEDGKIKLVHWFNKNTRKKYVDRENRKIQHIIPENLCRLVLREASLTYVTDCIRLLS